MYSGDTPAASANDTRPATAQPVESGSGIPDTLRLDDPTPTNVLIYE